MDSNDLLGVDPDNHENGDRDNEQDLEQLALNSNFDPSMLLGYCWDDDEEDEEDEAAALEREATSTTRIITTTATTATASSATARAGDSSSASHSSGGPPPQHHHRQRVHYHTNKCPNSISELPGSSNINNAGDSSASLFIQLPDEMVDSDDAAWVEFDKAHHALLMAASATMAAPSSHMDKDTNNNDSGSHPPPQSSAAGDTQHDTNNNSDHQDCSPAIAAASFHKSAIGANASSPASNNNNNDTEPFLPTIPITLLNTGNNNCNNGTATTATATMDSSMLLPLAYNALAAGVDLSSFFCMPQQGEVSNGFASSTSSAPGGGGATAVTASSITPSLPLPGTCMESVIAAAVAAAGIPHSVMLSAQPTATTTTEEPSMAESPGHTIPACAVSTSNAPIPPPQSSTKKNPLSGTTSTTKKRASSGTSSRRARCSSSKSQQRPQKHGRKNSKSCKDEEEEPPFMLFDAPVELRHNFVQSQRAHGLPVLQDNNSYHFTRSMPSVSTTTTGVATNGEGGLPMFVARPAAPSGPMPRLVDARHGDHTAGNKRLKNAKEQKRAQRITELIEQLRIRMEKGGWKVGIKSKLHTLSSCSDYVKHLVQTTKEKESAVEQAKRDLEAKRRKLEEEKSSQQDPSEPESTTSSLTVSSGSRSINKSNCKKDPSEYSSAKDSFHLKSPPQQSNGVGSSSTDNSGPSSEGNNSKHQQSSAQETNSSEEYGSSIDQDDFGKLRQSHGAGRRGFEGYKSSISDITDHNKYTGGSDEATMTAPAATSDGALDNGDTTAVLSTQNTVCSDAAVGETSDPKGPASHDSSTCHGDGDYTPMMAIQTITTTTCSGSSHRKRKPDYEESQSSSRAGKKSKKAKSQEMGEIASLGLNFQLDYEEVFLKSNVPQMIASTTGRILAHNDIFLRVTRLRRSQVERMTIFSLVQPSMLSNLFELVAVSLREDDDDQRGKKQEQSQQEKREVGEPKDSNGQKTTPLQDYSTMTLPCVPFAGCPTIFMTVTLMRDEDVKKRCFHCVFTDRAPGGSKGSVGSVTPQLLETLFKSKPLSGGSNSGSTSCTGESNQGSESSGSNAQSTSARFDNGSDTKSSCTPPLPP